jgi:LysM repeat protein
MKHPPTAFAVALTAFGILLPPPAPAGAQSACGAFRTVDTGDSLLEIAEQCGVTLPALLAANPGVTDRTDLNVGDRLRIPDPDDPQPGPQEACGSVYTVRTGDTLAEIAGKCGLTVPLILAANPPLPDPLGLHDGLRIDIPPLPRAAVMDTLTFVARPAAPTGMAGRSGAPTSGRPAALPLTVVTGTLLYGERCTVVRAGDGSTTGVLGGPRGTFGPGDRVTLLGVPADAGRCGTDQALALRIMYRTERPQR